MLLSGVAHGFVVCCVLCVVFGWCCGKSAERVRRECGESVERVVTGGGKGWMLFYRYKKTRRSGFF